MKNKQKKKEILQTIILYLIFEISSMFILIDIITTKF